MKGQFVLMVECEIVLVFIILGTYKVNARLCFAHMHWCWAPGCFISLGHV